MKRIRACICALIPLVLLASAATSPVAQVVLPPENHYKVYNASSISFVESLLLTDQFGSFNVLDLHLQRFANPAEKIHPETGESFPMLDPERHHTWWRFLVPQPERTVVGIDQFGVHSWTLRDAHYLLNPALKNVPGGAPPVANHYVCYEVIGAPDILRTVILVDQFGTTQVQVLRGKYFCNPVEKVHLDDGSTYPIIDYAAHLACYQTLDPNQFAVPITTIDQFGYWQIEVFDSDCLCVPSLKDHPVRTEESTWGRVKALYR